MVANNLFTPKVVIAPEEGNPALIIPGITAAIDPNAANAANYTSFGAMPVDLAAFTAYVQAGGDGKGAINDEINRSMMADMQGVRRINATKPEIKSSHPAPAPTGRSGR